MVQRTVLQFLETQNRPYSLTDIQNNLGKEFGKGAIQKALDFFVENGQVKEKSYGKQKVYFVTQDPGVSQSALKDEIIILDRKINELSNSLRDISKEIKEKESEWGEAKGALTLPQACARKLQLEEELRGLKEALVEFRGMEPVSLEVKSKAEKDYNASLDEYKKRKRMCKDILDSILENYPKTKAQLVEDVGLELDEDVDFNPNNFLSV